MIIYIYRHINTISVALFQIQLRETREQKFLIAHKIEKKKTSFARKLIYTWIFISIQFSSIALFNSKELKKINKYSSYNLQYYLYTFLEIIKIVMFIQPDYYRLFLESDRCNFSPFTFLYIKSLYHKWICTEIHFK